MDDTPQQENNIAEEIHNFGQNLLTIFRTAWDNPERKRVQQDVEKGFGELGQAIQREAEYFAESPTGQRLRSDVEKMGEQLRDSDTQEKIRTEILSILKNANQELQKVVDTLTPEDVSEQPETSEETTSKETPDADSQAPDPPSEEG